MRSNSESNGQAKPSFIEAARRKQIVDTAIRTIATRGYSQASLAEIAREAGISKGVISYHFEGKVELVAEILSLLLREPAEFIKRRVDAGPRAMDKLRAYVTANFEFMKTHRDHYVALVDLWESRGSETANRFSAEAYEPSRSYLSRILEKGEASGEFRRLSHTSVASVIQAAIDGVMLQWVFDESAVDLDACRDQILEMVTLYVVIR
ncbi:MAG TPA: TetR/AcrR family transcriptional regulator [Candidatus Polarisedimenticolaceae bacterium]|nr:TetR/AcrR family transcriptional regulator [Candidatus Polarisedimenticolaceae bacterium]